MFKYKIFDFITGFGFIASNEILPQFENSSFKRILKIFSKFCHYNDDIVTVTNFSLLLLKEISIEKQRLIENVFSSQNMVRILCKTIFFCGIHVGE